MQNIEMPGNRDRIFEKTGCKPAEKGADKR